MDFMREGVKIHYEDEGSGLPVIWAHPFPFDHGIWDAQGLLSKQFRIIRPDLRGFGKSDIPEGPYRVETHADDLAALLGHLGVEKAVWAGLSMGGYVCLAALERHPQRVAGVIFAGSRVLADTEETRRARSLNAARIRGGGFEEFTKAMPQRLLGATTLRDRPEEAGRILAAIRRQKPEAVAWALEGMGSRKNQSVLFGSWEGPVLIIHGEEDAFVPLAEARENAGQLRHGRSAWIPGAGHLMNIEKPDEFNRAVEEWLGTLSLPSP